MINLASEIGGLFFGVIGFLNLAFKSFTMFKSDMSMLKRLYSQVDSITNSDCFDDLQENKSNDDYASELFKKRLMQR